MRAMVYNCHNAVRRGRRRRRRGRGSRPCRRPERPARPHRTTAKVLESIQDGFFTVDRNWRFAYVNRRAASNLGLEPEELTGENLWDKFPEIVGTAHEAAYRRAMETRETQHFEILGVLTEQWYSITAYPSDAGLSVYWQDITERKQTEDALRRAHEELQVRSEELAVANEELQARSTQLRESEQRLRMALEGGRMGCWEWDLVTDTMFWCARTYELLGVETFRRARVETLLDCIHPDDRQAMKSHIAQVMNEATDFQAEFRVLRPRHEPRREVVWLALHARVSPGRAGAGRPRDRRRVRRHAAKADGGRAAPAEREAGRGGAGPNDGTAGPGGPAAGGSGPPGAGRGRATQEFPAAGSLLSAYDHAVGLPGSALQLRAGQRGVRAGGRPGPRVLRPEELLSAVSQRGESGHL